MIPDETVEEFVERTTKASGVPYHVTDPATLQRIARLLLQSDTPADPKRGAK